MKTTEQRWAIVEPYSDSADEYVLMLAHVKYETRATLIKRFCDENYFSKNGDSRRTFKKRRGLRVVRVMMRWPKP